MNRKILLSLGIVLTTIVVDLNATRARSYAYKGYAVHTTNTVTKNLKRGLYPDKILEIPLVRQSTNWTCGVASLMAVLSYFGIEYREDILAEALESNPDIGTNYLHIVALATKELQKKYPQATVVARNGMTIEDLQNAVDKGNLVQVAFQAWADDPKKVQYKTDNDDGHYSIVIGYDAQNLYFMDPSTIGNYTHIPKKEFLDRWHDVDGTTNKPVINFGIEYALNAPYKSSYKPKSIVEQGTPHAYPYSMVQQEVMRTTAKLMHVPKTFQPSNWTSLLAALQSVLYYFGIEYRPDTLAEDLGITANTLKTNQFVTVPLQKIADFALSEMKKNNPQSKIEVQTLTLTDLQKALDDKKPVIVESSPWTDAITNFDDGRFAVAIGYDTTHIFLLDPSTLGHYVGVPFADFEKRWLKNGILFSNGTYQNTAVFNPAAFPKLD